MSLGTRTSNNSQLIFYSKGYKILFHEKVEFITEWNINQEHQKLQHRKNKTKPQRKINKYIMLKDAPIPLLTKPEISFNIA